MVNPASNSLLAAQIYGSAVQQGGARVDTSARRAEFEEAAKEAKAVSGSEETSRSFPVDQVELSSVPDDETDQTFEAPGEDAARRFAREAPGTAAPRIAPPGSRLDIRV